MAEIIDVNLLINTAQSANSIKEVKASLKDLKSAALQFGEGSEGFRKVTQATAQLKDRLDDVNKTVKAFDPDRRLGSFIDVARGIAGGFSVATGAMGLFGEKNEEVEKSILKVQSAIAILNGIQELANIRKQAAIVLSTTFTTATAAETVALGAEATAATGAATATTALAAAVRFLMGPIGIAITVVTALVGAFVLLTKSSRDAAEAMEASLKSQIDINNAATKNIIDNFDARIAMAKAAGLETVAIEEEKNRQLLFLQEQNLAAAKKLAENGDADAIKQVEKFGDEVKKIKNAQALNVVQVEASKNEKILQNFKNANARTREEIIRQNESEIAQAEQKILRLQANTLENIRFDRRAEIEQTNFILANRKKLNTDLLAENKRLQATAQKDVAQNKNPFDLLSETSTAEVKDIKLNEDLIKILQKRIEITEMLIKAGKSEDFSMFNSAEGKTLFTGPIDNELKLIELNERLAETIKNRDIGLRRLAETQKTSAQISFLEAKSLGKAFDALQKIESGSKDVTKVITEMNAAYSKNKMQSRDFFILYDALLKVEKGSTFATESLELMNKKTEESSKSVRNNIALTETILEISDEGLRKQIITQRETLNEIEQEIQDREKILGLDFQAETTDKQLIELRKRMVNELAYSTQLKAVLQKRADDAAEIAKREQEEQARDREINLGTERQQDFKRLKDSVDLNKQLEKNAIELEAARAAAIREGINSRSTLEMEELIRIKEANDKQAMQAESMLKHKFKLDDEDLANLRNKTDEETEIIAAGLRRRLRLNATSNIEDPDNPSQSRKQQRRTERTNEFNEQINAIKIRNGRIKQINDELAQAQTSERVAELEEEKEFLERQVQANEDAAKKKADIKRHEREAAVAAIQALQSISTSAFNAEAESYRQKSDEQIADIERVKNARLSEIDETTKAEENFGRKQTKREIVAAQFQEKQELEKQRVEADSAEKISAIRRRQFEHDKKMSIARALIDGGLGVLRAYATATDPVSAQIQAIAIGAATLANVAIIRQQEAPEYGTGGVINGASHKQGGVNINAEGGEVVINKKSAKKFMPILSKINEAGGGRKLIMATGGVVPGGSPMDLTRLENILANNQTPVVQAIVVEREISTKQNDQRLTRQRTSF